MNRGSRNLSHPTYRAIYKNHKPCFIFGRIIHNNAAPISRLGATRSAALRLPTSRSPVPHFTLPRVGFALNRVGLALRANLAASGRDSTTCCPSYLSRASLAGRGKAPPCPPNQRRARQSHAPTLDASRIARSAIPTSNNATPRSGDTTPCHHVTLSPRSLRPRFPSRPSAAHTFALLLAPPRGVFRPLAPPPYRDHRKRQGT